MISSFKNWISRYSWTPFLLSQIIGKHLPIGVLEASSYLIKKIRFQRVPSTVVFLLVATSTICYFF